MTGYYARHAGSNASASPRSRSRRWPSAAMCSAGRSTSRRRSRCSTRFVAAGFNLIDTADVYSRGPRATRAASPRRSSAMARAGGRRDESSSPPRSAWRWARGKGCRAATSCRPSRTRCSGSRPTTSTSTRRTRTTRTTPLEETLGAFGDLIRQGRCGRSARRTTRRERLSEALDVSEAGGLPRYETPPAALQPLRAGPFEGRSADSAAREGSASSRTSRSPAGS